MTSKTYTSGAIRRLILSRDALETTGGEHFIIGFDEVGRGALAGPLLVGAVAMSRRCAPARTFGVLKDSKALSRKKREAWEEWVAEESRLTPLRLAATVISVSRARIDREGVSAAANQAAHAALLRLLARMGGAPRTISIRLDGGLYIGSRSHQETLASEAVDVRTVVRGDTTIDAIKLASIVAKMKRDRLMERAHREYPRYAFDRNKGYGTADHIRALCEHGACPLHRLTFRWQRRTIAASERHHRPFR
ncbi:MAG: ribonuclease HII [Candidatus Colwellbacteria bacterium]|nr:ribonuclease HII [Candidatus Colwellbacteria bacterium]